MKKIYQLSLTLLCVICLIGCTKEQIIQDSTSISNTENSNTENNNQLVGTSWSGLLWSVLSNKESVCIEFASNTQVYITLLFKGNVETTVEGSYTLEGNSIVFHCNNIHGYCYNFVFKKATFTNTIMTLQGTQSGDEKTWTLNKK